MDSESKMWDRLFQLLAKDDDRQTVYGYRLDRFGKAMKPYLFRWYMHDSLLESIRNQYGSGEYRLLIREGRTMVFSGVIGLAAPLKL